MGQRAGRENDWIVGGLGERKSMTGRNVLSKRPELPVQETVTSSKNIVEAYTL